MIVQREQRMNEASVLATSAEMHNLEKNLSRTHHSTTMMIRNAVFQHFSVRTMMGAEKEMI